VSGDLGTKIQLGLDELATVREQISPLIAKAPSEKAEAIETAAACAMLHSFYTEIEKIPPPNRPRLGRATADLGCVA
jgi:hypothetical protein